MRTVTITDGDQIIQLVTMRSNPDAILAQAGITLFPYDEIEVLRSEINVLRSFEVTVTADGETKTLQVLGGTVSDALVKADIFLGSDDLLSAGYADALIAGMDIRVDRITYETVTKTEKIPFEVNTEYTTVLKKGTSQVLVSGESGVNTSIYKNMFVNGKLESSVLQDKYTSKKPVTEKRLAGSASATPVSTKVSGKDISLDAKGQPLSYKTMYEGRATAYSARAGAGTASGRRAMVGHVAVDPNKIPYGSRLYIVSADGKFVYGQAVAADTGTAMRTGHALVDLYFNTNAECRAFGARTLRVYVLD